MGRMLRYLFLSLSLLVLVSAADPNVKLYENFNQALNVINPGGTSTGGTVHFLGPMDTTAECQSACIASKQRCWSFVYLGSEGTCYGVTSPGFNPSYDQTATSGVVEWPCRDDADCSLNGKCSPDGSCSCRPAWKGLRCELLNLKPTPPGSGYRGVDDGHNTSSWGGAVLPGPDGKYHMWAAEITEHCGIGAWVKNSRIIRATSDSISGPYTRTQVVWEVFAHEPDVVPGPDGEYIMYFTANPRSEHGWCDCCRAGEGPCDGSTGSSDCPGGSPGEGASYMSHTKDPVNGNWSEPVQIFKDYMGGDTNFAPFVMNNGSLVAMWRHWGGGNGGSRMFLATGKDWSDPDTYIQHQTELFPDLGAAGTEDQFLYQDTDGNFHAVFHHMYGTGTESQWWLDATGGHAFSRDGWEWTYTGVSWGNATARYNTPTGQGATVHFTDGTSQKYTRLERPHLAFAGTKPNTVGDPTHLITSAQYGLGTNPHSSGANNDDQCMTLIQPVNQK